MDTKIIVPQIASPTWAKDEVAQAVLAKLSEYKGAVYTPDTVKNAKADRAELNKLAKALDDERKRVKALYSAPYEAFEKEVKSIVNQIAECSAEIDKQVKAFEEAEKHKKMDAIREMFDGMDFHGIAFEKVYDPKWLNATTSLASVKKDLENRLQQVDTDLAVIDGVDEYKFEAVEEYKASLSLAIAMSEVQRLKDLARRKAEHEARLRGEAEKAKEQAELPKEEPKEVKQETPSISYDDDGLPDFSSIGDQRHAVSIHMKVTNAEEMQVTQFLQSIGVEFYVTV